MIKNKEDLKRYLTYEKKLYFSNSIKDNIIGYLCHDVRIRIWKYVKYLRYTEYYYNMNKNIYRNIMYLIYRRKKNILGEKLGIEIWENTFDIGLNIWHSANIVVNGQSRVGKNCLIHGSTCIGKSNDLSKSPIIGNNCDIGVGAKILGDINLANNIVIGSQSVVNKTFDTNNITIVGIPAKIIKKEE